MHTHTNTHINTHTCTHTCKHTHVHTHTYTHTRARLCMQQALTYSCWSQFFAKKRGALCVSPSAKTTSVLCAKPSLMCVYY